MPKTSGISLHIGLNLVDPNHYAGWSGRLYACEADAEDMAELAKSRGYRSTTLLTKAATRAAVSAAITDIAAELKPGDIFFLTYSGHGGQLPDRNGDEENDGLDETWCLYDGELIDDSLYGLFGRFKAGVRILVLSDSCHSGSVTKEQYDRITAAYEKLRRFDPVTGEILTTFRGMPIDIARRTYLENRAEYDALLDAADPEARSKINATVRLISGCQDDQLSSDGIFNGAFTGCLKRIWKNGKFTGDYNKFHKDIQTKMPATQQPVHFVYGAKNDEYAAQLPFTI